MAVEINKRFASRDMSNHQALKVGNIKNFASDLENVISELAPNCRERSIALQRLEEAVMWASKAVSHN